MEDDNNLRVDEWPLNNVEITAFTSWMFYSIYWGDIVQMNIQVAGVGFCLKICVLHHNPK